MTAIRFPVVCMGIFGAALAACGGRAVSDPTAGDDATRDSGGPGAGAAGSTVLTGVGGAVPPGSGGAAGNAGRDATGGSAGSAGAGGIAGSGGRSGAGGVAGAGGMGASAGQDGTGGVPPIPPDGDDDCTRLFRMVNRNSWIAFDSNSDSARRSIFIMRPDASVVEQLTKGVNLDVEPSLSPDGKSVSFTSDRAGVSQIFIMHLEQRTPRQLTFRPEGADQSAFSRDGKLIAFHSGAAIYTINVDGSDERLVATGATASDGYFGPEFSADGAELVFDRTYEIDAVRLDGSGLRTIVRNVTTVMKAPAVSFEGTEIAYDVSCDTGKSSVWISPVAATTNRCGEQRVTLIGDFKLGQPLEAKRPTWISSTVLAYEYVHDDTKLGSIGLTSRTGREICLVGPAAADCRNPSGAP